jgi:acyl transferase domain-containing protein/acyl carrier protein
MASNSNHASAIAIVGLGCRVPGANSPREFWRNLRDGVESVRRLSTEELVAARADIGNPKLVPAAALVADVEMFDAAFFGIPAREAELMDPQHRLFLECAWETLEDAACDPARYDGAIAVFGGGIFDSYVTLNLLPSGVFDDAAGNLQTVLANEKDYMVSRVAYKLNLRGAALNVQTGCSTSLVAVHLACQSLLNFESDMALAGGVAVDTARRQGYIFHEGSVFSPDGHCRAFDADARGTVFGNGVAMVALKRLDDAMADGDAIRAIILGTAINNDGSVKVGFTAPSVAGQSQVIAEALSAAGVEPASIDYIEAHGTGTQLGDPIEIQAMAKAFADANLPPRSVGIGSVKTNIGHLDAAAGAASLIKTVLALEHGLIPPTLHFKRPNPELDLNRTPFAVVAEPRPWAAGRAGQPRRAGVSSFGIGGTNAHAVIEEAPAVPPSDPSRGHEVLVLSARSHAALDAATLRLAEHLRSEPSINLADAAFSLQEGRAIFRHRRAIACRDVDDAVRQLAAAGAGTAPSHEFSGEPPRIAFMFPGQGAQYAGMARGLYESEPVFRRAVDECAAVLRPEIDLVQVITATDDKAAATPTAIAQPALFAVEYSLAQLWRAWGVEPDALIGHSVGEYVAACLAGVFSMPDALRLVAERGRLMQQMPAGAMTAVPLAADALVLAEYPGLDLAAVNAPALSVVSGPIDAIERFEAAQRTAGIECRRLVTSHAFHSASMDPILETFASRVRSMALRAPQRKFISNVTGTWITDEQATSAEYWARHLRAPVLFGAGIASMLDVGVDFFVEVGPGRTAATLAALQRAGVAVATSLPGATDQAGDRAVLLNGVARAWMAGAPIDWKAYRGSQRRRRIPLPAYPFERQRHWIEIDEAEAERHRARLRANQKAADVRTWTYVRGWQLQPPAGNISPGNQDATWLVLSDGSPVAQQIIDGLSSRVSRSRLIVATAGAPFAGHLRGATTFDLTRDADYDALVSAAASMSGGVLSVLHLTATGAPASREAEMLHGFFSLAKLGGALARVRPAFATVKVITSGVDSVTGAEPLVPERATLDGLSLVLPQEQAHVRCQRIDLLPIDEALSPADLRVAVDEIVAGDADLHVAIRGARRWTPAIEKLSGEPIHESALRQNGHYVVIGGLGTIGFSLAWYMAKTAGARLSIVSRTAVPGRGAWQSWIDTHSVSDPIGSRIRRIFALEQAGAQVLPLTADAADPAAMRQALADAERTFGPIHGVVTAAGLMDESAFAPVELLEPAAVAAHFRPKLEGLPALAEALGARPVDFCFVMSSLSVVLGGVGYAMYAAANAYLDAFVYRQNAVHGGRWSVINWDAWHPLEGTLPATSLLARLAMHASEAVMAFDRLLRYRGLTQVLVSTGDLVERVRFAVPERIPPLPGEAPMAAAAETFEYGFVPPPGVTPTEAVVLSIWQQTLGAPRVELHDTFLDLGGSSLTAIQVIGRIETELGVKITIEEFIFQTAAQLAALCDSRRPVPVAEPATVAADAAEAAGAAPSRGWSRLRQVLRS